MHDPVIEEIWRARADAIRPEVFKRWQKYLADVVDPQLAKAAEDAEKRASTRRKTEAVA